MFKTGYKVKFSKRFLIFAMFLICCIGLTPMYVMANDGSGNSTPVVNECNCTDNCGWLSIANEECLICSEDYTKCEAVIPECSCEGDEMCTPSHRKADCDFCAYKLNECLGSSEFALTLQYPDNNDVITQKNNNIFQVPSEAPVLNGYAFLYWTDINREGSVFTPGSYYCIDGKEATLKALFGVIVNFKPGVDEDVEIKDMPGTIQSAGTQQQTISLDEYCPTREGYEFLGWSDGTNIVPEVQLGGDNPDSVTVTAMWELIPEDSIEDDTEEVDDDSKIDDTEEVDDDDKIDDAEEVDDDNKIDNADEVVDNNKIDNADEVVDNNKIDKVENKVESTSSTQSKTPKTGDSSNMTMWIILMMVSLAGIGTTLVYRKNS